MLSNDQLKQFIDGVFYKHAVTNPDTLSIGELYEFFCNFFGGKDITLNDVQKTLLLVKTQSSQKITKKEMYNVLKNLMARRREGLKQKPNMSLNIEELNNKVKKEKSKPKNEKVDSAIKPLPLPPPPSVQKKEIKNVRSPSNLQNPSPINLR